MYSKFLVASVLGLGFILPNAMHPVFEKATHWAVQDTLALALQNKIKIPESTALGLDATGNIYVLHDRNTLEKYSAQGQKRSQFSQNRLGNVTAINVTNPLKVMVWYADFKTVLFLDRSLTQLGGALNLVDKGFPEVRTLAPAADGQLWLLDEVEFKLRKVSAAGDPLKESQDLNLLLGNRLGFIHLMDNGNQVVAADTLNGLLIFDVFGQFQKQIQVPEPALPMLLDGNLVRWIGPSGMLYQVDLNFPAVVQSWHLPVPIQQATVKQLYAEGVAVLEQDSVAFWH